MTLIMVAPTPNAIVEPPNIYRRIAFRRQIHIFRNHGMHLPPYGTPVRIALGRCERALGRPLPQETAFLKAFGQPERVSPCLCDRSSEPSLDQALQLLNGKHVFDQVQNSLQKYGPLEPAELIRNLYLTAFSRYPSPAESESTTAFLASSANRDEAIRDLVWAIVNTQEFMFQH